MEFGKYVLIACGGAAGAVARFVVTSAAQRLTDSSFPFGTLIVNVAGCAAIGVAAAVLAGPAFGREDYRLALVVGFLGAFTTFSAFGFETFALLMERAWWSAFANVAISNVAGLLAVWLGYRLTLVVQGG
jgi:CrcB protein